MTHLQTIFEFCSENISLSVLQQGVSNAIALSREVLIKGKLSTVYLLIKVACFVKKSERHFQYKTLLIHIS